MIEEGSNTKQNWDAGRVAINHGGHEVNDILEVLGGMVGTLDQYMMFQQYIRDPELSTILQQQYQFMLDEYNMLVQSFATGQDPSHGTIPYQMDQSNEVVYGLRPSQPHKPKQSLAEISDQSISCYMAELIKSMVSMKSKAAVEVTNPVVRRVLADSIPNCIEMAYEIFLYQNKHGYYQVPQFSESDMKQMISSYTTFQPQIH